MLEKILNYSFSGKRKFVSIGILVLLSYVLFKKPAIKVETVTASKGDIVEAISASGEVDANQKVRHNFT